MFTKTHKIEKVFARQILDSRGIPTLEVRVTTNTGVTGIASVPSGSSTGKKEAFELRDQGRSYFGKGVSQAVENVNTEIARYIQGTEVTNQQEIDKRLIQLDGTEDKSRLGGNSLIGVSQAAVRAAAHISGVPLFMHLRNISGLKIGSTMPRPMFNMINGGLHSESGLDIQEYLFIPNTETAADAVRMGAEVYRALYTILSQKKLGTGVGDEGGFAPKLKSNTMPFDLIREAASAVSYQISKHYGLGVDVAANSLVFKSEPFQYRFDLDKLTLDSHDLISLYEKWADEYGLVAIEDGLAEDDKEAWKELTAALSNKLHVAGWHFEIVGGDLFVLNAKRLVEGVKEKLASAIVIKPNQVGTITETINAVVAAKRAKMTCVASHRAGDTMDTFITDLAVGLGCEYLKAGGLARGERVEKYNRLTAIEMHING